MPKKMEKQTICFVESTKQLKIVTIFSFSMEIMVGIITLVENLRTIDIILIQ